VGLFAVAGVLEGFYGTPWSWDERVAIMEQCVPAGLDWYVWAPKSDPLHRKLWRDPFTEEHLDGFRRLLKVDGLQLGIAIAPGMSPGDDLAADVAALVAKLSPVVELGATLIMVAFDDLEAHLADGMRHAQIVSALIEHFIDHPELRWVAVPVHYATVEPSEYLTALAAGLPADVLIGWTGPLVVNESISAQDAEVFADAVDGRPLLLWDNHPVNDAVMADRLFLMPPSGRDPLLGEFCGAYLANAGVQAWPSLPGLLGAAAYASTGVAEAKWDDLDDPVNTALLAQACDGRELYRLAVDALETEAGSLDDLWWWLERMEDLELSGPLGEAAEPWIVQARVEAEVSLLALDLLEREPGDDEVSTLVFTLFQRWPAARRGTHTVFGPRFALNPAFGVSSGGEWQLSASALVEDRNVTDFLCRAALARHRLTP
jgi:hyaluronoglucosaminidase